MDTLVSNRSVDSPAYPGQCDYVQSILANEAALHYLVLRDITETKLQFRTARYSAFAQSVASEIARLGLNPRTMAKNKIIKIAAELAEIMPRKKPLRIIHLRHPKGRQNYVRYLKTLIDDQNQIILRAADRIEKIKEKIKKVQALRS